MRSSTGEYFVGLDHIRAMAVFLVFMLHFLNANGDLVAPPGGAITSLAFSVFAEGHTGVSIFMVLSGYLFARITRDRNIDYGRFLLARAWRLLPLLLIVSIIDLIMDAALHGSSETVPENLKRILTGLFLPTLPNGGWSITVEFHFYMLFPFLMLIDRRIRFGMALVILLAVVLRFLYWFFVDDVPMRDIAYWTILGRIDQFGIGILFARHSSLFANRHVLGVSAILGILFLYSRFDSAGGFVGSSAFAWIWIFLLTLEGVLYGAIIAWYDGSFAFSDTGISGFIAKIGAASYSIYLLHVFFVFRIARFVESHILPLDIFANNFVAGLLCFIPICGISWLSYWYVERYFLRFRISYFLPKSKLQ